MQSILFGDGGNCGCSIRIFLQVMLWIGQGIQSVSFSEMGVTVGARLGYFSRL